MTAPQSRRPARKVVASLACSRLAVSYLHSVHEQVDWETTVDNTTLAMLLLASALEESGTADPVYFLPWLKKLHPLVAAAVAARFSDENTVTRPLTVCLLTIGQTGKLQKVIGHSEDSQFYDVITGSPLTLSLPPLVVLSFDVFAWLHYWLTTRESEHAGNPRQPGSQDEEVAITGG